MARRAFTIVELLIAIGLLAVVIIAASKILGTTTQVSGLGEANANVTQEAEAVEKQLRQDLARLDLDGYLVVRCVGVRNDVNRERYGAAAPLLNPVLPANAMLRCDQVVFFMKGAEDTQQYVGGSDLAAGTGASLRLRYPPRSSSVRVVLGHGVQVPDLTPVSEIVDNRLDPIGFDDGPLVPWAWDPPGSGQLRTSGSQSGGGPTVNGAQPEARNWVLARQAILLADDGDIFDNGPLPSAQLGFHAVPRIVESAEPGTAPDGSIATDNLVPGGDLAASRTDLCGQNLSDLRRVVELFGSGERRPWLGDEGTRNRIVNATFGPNSGANWWTRGLGAYPRAERRAPSTNRLDAMLTSPTIVSNCSDFMVDWTWADRTGQVLNPDGSVAVLSRPLAGANGASPILWGVRQLGYEADPSAVEIRPTTWTGTAPALPYRPDWLTNGVPNAWFGFGDYGIDEEPDSKLIPNDPRQVVTLQWPRTWFWRNTQPYEMVMFQQSAPVHYAPIDGSVPSRIEGPPFNISGGFPSNGPWTRPYGGGVPVYVYTAVFGFNNDRPTETVTVTDAAGVTASQTVLRDDYTPWPSALRFTMRIHDADAKLAEGRLYQFVVDLPRRGVRPPAAQANAQGVLR